MKLFVQEPQLEQQNIAKSSKLIKGVKSLWSLCFDSSKKQIFRSTLYNESEKSGTKGEKRYMLNDNIQITKQDNKVLIDLSRANKSASDFKSGFSTFTPFFDIVTSQRSQIRQTIKQEKIHLKMYSEPYKMLSARQTNQDKRICRITQKRERREVLRNRYHKILQNQQRNTQIQKYRVDNNQNPQVSNIEQKNIDNQRTTKKQNKNIHCTYSKTKINDEKYDFSQIEEVSEQYLSVSSFVQKKGVKKLKSSAILIPQFHKEQKNIKEILEKQYINPRTSLYINPKLSSDEQQKILEIVSDEPQQNQKKIETQVSVVNNKTLGNNNKEEKTIDDTSDIKNKDNKQQNKQSPKYNPFLQKAASKLNLNNVISTHQSKINQINTDANKNRTTMLNNSTVFNLNLNPSRNTIVFPTSNNSNFHHHLISNNPNNLNNLSKSSPNNQYLLNIECKNNPTNIYVSSPYNIQLRPPPNSFLSSSDREQALAMFSIESKNPNDPAQNQSIFDHQIRENTTKKSARPRKNKQMRIY